MSRVSTPLESTEGTRVLLPEFILNSQVLLEIKIRQIQIEWNTVLEPQLSPENIILSSREFWSLVSEEEEGAGSLGAQTGLCIRSGGHMTGSVSLWPLVSCRLLQSKC